MIQSTNSDLTTTLVILKPDTVQRGLIGEILSRLERVGLVIDEMALLQPKHTDWHQHYEVIGKVGQRHGQDVLETIITFMMQGPVVVLILRGIEVVETVRKLIGNTEPKSALPGTIRGDYAHSSYAWAKAHNLPIHNLIHASATNEEAEQEIACWSQVVPWPSQWKNVL